MPTPPSHPGHTAARASDPTAVSPSARPGRSRPPWRADLLTALTGISLEAVAAFFVVIASGLTNSADPDGSNGGADRAGQILVIGFGALACLALLISFLSRTKAPITALLHLLLSGVLLLAVLTLPSSISAPRGPAPGPAPATRTP